MMFIAFEFGFYSGTLEMVERWTDKESFVKYCMQKTKQGDQLYQHIVSYLGLSTYQTPTHSSSNVLLAGMCAGAMAGFLTNAAEYLAVNK